MEEESPVESSSSSGTIPVSTTDRIANSERQTSTESSPSGLKDSTSTDNTGHESIWAKYYPKPRDCAVKEKIE